MINRAQITIEIKPFFIVFTFFLEFQVVEGFKRSYTAKTCGYIKIDHEETLLACTFFPDLKLYSTTRLYFSYTFYIHIDYHMYYRV